MLDRMFKIKEAGSTVRTEIIAGVSEGGRTGLAIGFVSCPIIKLFCGKGREVYWIVYLLSIIFIAEYLLV